MDINVDEALSIRNNFAKYKDVESILIKGVLLKKSKYSIVIPTYKRVDTLKDTLESALNQDYNGEYDIIVCDNNPEKNDETERFMLSMKDTRILYYKNEENIGMTGNWNRCIELCDGEYAVMIHDDDILLPNFLSQCDKVLRRFKSIKMLYPNRISWYQSKSESYPIPNIKKKARLYKMHLIDFYFQGMAPTGILINKEEMIRLGGFYEGVYPASDLYFHVKAIINSEVFYYTMPLSVYRWGINESFKLDTLLKFMLVYNPLRIIIGKLIGLPRFYVEYSNRHYCNNNYLVIKEKCPNELSNIDIDRLDLPHNVMEMLLYKIITRTILFFVGLKHKVCSKRI